MVVRKIIFLSVGGQLSLCQLSAKFSPINRILSSSSEDSDHRFSIEAGQSLFGCLDLLQFFIPPALQLAGYETIPGIHRVILLKRLLGFVLQLLESAGQGGALRSIPGAQFLQRLQTGFHSQRRDHLQELLAQPAVYRDTAKSEAILAPIVIVPFAEITGIGAGASPVAYV